MNIAIFNPGQTPQYLMSVNGAEYLVDVNAEFPVSNDQNVLLSPDISAVQAVPLKYWKLVGTTIFEMTPAEKQAIADAELLERKNQVNDFGVRDMKPILIALIKVINIRLPAGQKITKQELVDAIKLEVV